MRSCPTRSLPIALIALLAGPAVAQSKDGETSWQVISPRGPTSCAFGTPFEFWVREGDANQILIYLQGGGACWSLESCDPRRAISFDPAIDSTDYQQRRFGVFDRTAIANPFRPMRAVCGRLSNIIGIAREKGVSRPTRRPVLGWRRSIARKIGDS